MKVLLAEDDLVSRTLLVTVLTQWGYEVVGVPDGAQAVLALQSDNDLRLAILDWIMPEMEGPEVVRKVRECIPSRERYVYIILLTQKDSRSDIVEGLASGADDYMVKPFDHNELKARITTGQRIAELQQALASANADLRSALAQVKKLSGLLPICAVCKKIRDDKGYWQQIESYISEHSEALFSHGVCPDCAKKLYSGVIKKE